MEQVSQAFITPPPVSPEFDPALTNLKSSLALWIDKALRAPSLISGLTQLCQDLEVAISRGLITLPDRLRAAHPDRYARRLVYQDVASGVTVLAMVWGPGQSTPLHDHGGLWGIEAVLAGEIETVPHDLTAQQNGRYYFQARAEERIAAGATGYLMPPFEHHITRNVSHQVAISLNIYGGPMPACNIFLPAGPGYYTRQRRELTYTD